MDVTPLSDSSDMHAPSHCEKLFSSDFCQEFIGSFVRSAAGVIAGVKPAAVYSFKITSRCSSCVLRACPVAQYRSMMCDFAYEVELFGIKILPISPVSTRVHFLVYRADQVERIISDVQTQEFLRERGFMPSSWQRVIRDFRARLTRYHCGLSQKYPHEIGVILGPWRAYGNVEAARVRFKRLATAEQAFRTRFSQGESLFALLQSAGDTNVSAA